jgi:hypothetical protein
MNQIVELLDVIVEDNTAEKEAKLRFIEEILKSQKKSVVVVPEARVEKEVI